MIPDEATILRIASLKAYAVEEMEKAMHPHPTLSEAVAEAALAALGRAIHI